MYKVYCSNSEHALKRLQELTENNPTFRSFLEDHSKDHRVIFYEISLRFHSYGNLDCKVFLSNQCKDFASIHFYLKYRFHRNFAEKSLQELARNTPKEHADFTELIEVQKKFEGLVAHVNEAQRLFQAQNRILDVQNNIDGLPSV